MAERVTVSELVHGLLETKRGIYIAPERKTLASGQTSCVYFNIGDEIISYPYYKELIGNALAQTYQNIPTQIRANLDRLVGVPEGANMLTSSLGDRVGVGQLRMRETKTDHGDQSSIEGDYEMGITTIGIIEDVMSTGKSTIERLIQPAMLQGLYPRLVVTLINREYGGMPKMIELGLIARAFATTTEIAEVLINENLVNDQKIRLLKEELEELKD